MKFFLYIILIAYSAIGGLQSTAYSQKREQLITHWRGDKKTYSFTENGDWTDHKLSFAVKAGRAITDDRLIWKRNTLAGGDSSQIYASYSSTSGKTTFAITILQVDAEDLPGTDYVWDLEATDTSDTTDVTTLFDGIFRIKPDTQTRFDGVNIPPAGTRFHWAPLDSSAHEPGFLINRNSTNLASWISKDSTKKLLDVDDLENKTSHIVKVEEYIGALDTSLGWSLVIQAAVDANLGTGNYIIFNNNKLYELQGRASNPYQDGWFCVDLKTGGYKIIIPENCTLKLKDNQLTDARLQLQLFPFEYCENLYIGGGGTIDGNAEGQTGFTGGYQQGSNPQTIIAGHGLYNVFDRNKNIVIEDLSLNNSFSCPVNITSTTQVVMRRLRSSGVGEGLEVTMSEYVYAEDCYLSDSTEVGVGDGLEIALCRNVWIRGCRLDYNYDMSNFDIYGSKFVTISDFIAGGISTQSPEDDRFYLDNVVISDGILRKGRANNAGWGNACGTITYNNVLVDSMAYGFLITHPTNDVPDTGKMIITNCTFQNMTSAGGVILSGGYVIIDNNVFSNIALAGVNITVNQYVDTPTVHITNNTFDKCYRGVEVSAQAIPNWYALGSISGNKFTNIENSHIYGATEKMIDGGGNIIPRITYEFFSGEPRLGGVKEFTVSGSGQLREIRGALDQQVITLFGKLDQTIVYHKYPGATYPLNLRKAENWYCLPGESITFQFKADSMQYYEISRRTKLTSDITDFVDGWYWDNVSASIIDTTMLRGAGTLGTRFYIPRNCYLKRFGIRSNQARTAGELTMSVFMNGTSQGLTTKLDGTNTTSATATRNRLEAWLLPAGTYIEIVISTTSSWLPTTADITAWVELEY